MLQQLQNKTALNKKVLQKNISKTSIKNSWSSSLIEENQIKMTSEKNDERIVSQDQLKEKQISPRQLFKKRRKDG